MRKVYKLPDGKLTSEADAPGAVEVIPGKSQQMVTVEIVKPPYYPHPRTIMLFVCPTLERAKEIVTEGGHVLNNQWIDWGDGIHTATVASEPESRYYISPVEYRQ